MTQRQQTRRENLLELVTTRLLKLRNRHFLVADLLIFLTTPALALELRIDGLGALNRFGAGLLISTLLYLVVKLVVFYKGGLYSRFWQYAGVDELWHIGSLVTLAVFVQTALALLLFQRIGWISPEFPRSVPLLDGLLTLLAIGAVRFSVPFSERARQRRSGQREGKRVIVVGAGSAGVMIVQEMQRNPHIGMRPVGFVDDAADKQDMQIKGVPDLGRCCDIPKIVDAVRADQVVIAMPTAPGRAIREIVNICEQAGIETKTMPGIYDLLSGACSVGQLRNVQIEDLLRREPIQTDTAAVGEIIRGKRVLITGGGGSIGSELCRQVLRFQPASIIVLGHGENSVFEIESELVRLRDRGPDAFEEIEKIPAPRTEIRTVLADIRSRDRLRAVFADCRPDVVFHSAAHKHVPLMEGNPAEAVTNNVIGTRNVLEACRASGVGRFVMISTDKAVNPTSVMGASKRAAELLVHQAAKQTGLPYVAVRFGNVLGSRGSVVLTFQRQIATGGPLTVTDPEVRRYFMTIPEAVQLVLQAATLAHGGEVFMLDMGEPLKIVDLARDLIELSGLQVGQDIDIIFTGLRPGEKLFEELIITGEEYAHTRHEKIFTVASVGGFIPPSLDQQVRGLAEAAQNDDTAAILTLLTRLVPEYRTALRAADEQPPAPRVAAPDLPAAQPVERSPLYVGSSDS